MSTAATTARQPRLSALLSRSPFHQRFTHPGRYSRFWSWRDISACSMCGRREI